MDDKRERKNRMADASLTVEAAIMIPLMMFLLAGVMNLGIDLYVECRDTAIEIEAEDALDVVGLFRLVTLNRADT